MQALRRGMVHSHSRDSEDLPRLQDPVLEHAKEGKGGGRTMKCATSGSMRHMQRLLSATVLVLLLLLHPLVSQTRSTTHGAVGTGSSNSAAQPNCTSTGMYTNTRGQTVLRPENCSGPPKGATAHCRDGSYSFSQSRSGTCSHHGGVAKWL